VIPKTGAEFPLSLEEAVRARRATRAFLPHPVPREEVEHCLELARHTPSGGNLQGWHVHALAGEAFRRLVEDVTARLQTGAREQPEVPPYPRDLWEPLRTRRRRAGELRYEALGLTREMNGQAVLEELNLRCFGAPLALFFCLDRRVGPRQWADLGMFVQTFMLAAVSRGLATCPQAVWANWPLTLARHLELPPEQTVFAGMALGYPDGSSPLNAFRTERESVAAFTTFRGF
jgi:nitroreductase